MDKNDSVIVKPARSVQGSVRVPGDKSISHRYAMLAALAKGSTQLSNYSTAADCISTLNCMRDLGASWERTSAGDIEIRGCNSALRAPVNCLDCGNSGSTIRMLSGILAGQQFSSELFGDESLSRRPMERVISPLTKMGARIFALEGGRPPLRITGTRLHAIDYNLPIASAQVKTAILFAGLQAEGETKITEPVRTRDHTELALRAFGVDIHQHGLSVRIQGGQSLNAIAVQIPGDLSSAAFFLCAAAIFPDSHLILDQVLMNPTRARLLDWLAAAGLRISVIQIEEHHGELIGTLEVHGGNFKGGVIHDSDIAALIDEIPVLAAIAPYSENGLVFRNAKELRVKESDRISSIAAGLHAMGARFEEHDDGLTIPGRQNLHGAEVNSFGDHRIAMAFAIAALRASGETQIAGASASAVSFPAFFELLANVTKY
ncbi:MAG TPA: 3-phosphoshikimate 1-carboxyvinyltransferase [Terriglobales bacterium]|jgi:3-phosphoshikimate 1-carboxyvinyltransferase|nr:3-phosphoshikimate 1-carboxyvinyltransferase [Terriglobales bacterium]